MANKKITELTELTAANIANNDVLAIVDVGGDETKKVAISSLYDIFDNNVTIDTAKIVYGLTGANTNISALSVNTLPLIGGTITGPVVSYSINSSSNVSIAQSLAIGYVDYRVPQANLDVKDNVYIGGATTIAGALTLGTQLAVAQGGTGATSLTDGGVLLGSGTSAVTAMGVLGDGEVIVGDGSTDPVAESGDTLRNSIGVGSTPSGTVMQVYSVNASGNVSVGRSLAVGYTDGRVPQGNLDVKGNIYINGNLDVKSNTFINHFGNVSVGRSLAVGYTDARVPQANLDVHGNTYISGTTTLGTALTIASGGTGATSLTDGGVLLGSGTGAITALGVLSDGEMIVGDGSTDPVAESGSTLRTSIGVGTGDSPQFTAVNIGAATDTTVARASAGDINVEGNLIYRAGGTDVPVADGGTGASSFTDGYVLLGSGTGAITALNVTTKGSILAGDGSTDPQALAVGDDDQVLTADSGETTGLKWATSSGGGYFKGSQTTGSATTGPGDIFRINRANLNANATIAAENNASCTGPLTILVNQTLTVNGTVVVI